LVSQSANSYEFYFGDYRLDGFQTQHLVDWTCCHNKV